MTRIAIATMFAGTLLAQSPAPDQMKDKMGQMMKGKGKMMGTAATSPEMDHRDIAQLVEKLAQSAKDLESEQDHAALMTKLAEHRKLIEQLQAHIAPHAAAEPSKEAAPAADPHAAHH